MAHIIVILDTSGSMDGIKEQIVSSVNGFIFDQQKTIDDSRMTLITFSDRHNIVFEQVPISHVQPIKYSDYVPDGMTALYDAVYFALIRYGDNSSTLVIIVTDGEENKSATPRIQLNTLIEARKEAGWKFIYLCNNMDTSQGGIHMGLRFATRGARDTTTQNLVSPNMPATLRRDVSAVASAYRSTRMMPSIDKLSLDG